MRTRNKAILIRLNNEELLNLKTLVDASGWSQEAYLRALVVGVVPATRPPPEYLQMAAELRSIGVNLNQIAQKAHVLGVIDVQRYDTEARKLAATLTAITEAVKAPRKR